MKHARAGRRGPLWVNDGRETAVSERLPNVIDPLLAKRAERATRTLLRPVGDAGGVDDVDGYKLS